MQLGISGQLLGEVKELDKILSLLRRFKIKAIEIWPGNIPRQGSEVKYQDGRYEGRSLAKAGKLLESYAIRVACVTQPGAFRQDFANNKKAYVDALCHTIDVAGELGAKYVNHYAYYFTLNNRDNIDDFVSMLAPAVRYAEDKNIVMLLENEAHDATRTPEGMLNIIKKVGSRHFQTNFDAVNYYHASQEGFPYAYELLKEYIAYVHLKNGCIYNPLRGHLEEHKGHPFTGGHAPHNIYYPYIYAGAVNVEGLLLRLQDDHYPGYCMLEPHTTPGYAEEYYAKEIDYLRKNGFFA